MLVYSCAALIFVVSTSCLVSAFSTRFLIEGVDEGKKTQVVEETSTQKMEENNVVEKEVEPQGIAVEVIPMVTEIFSNTEDLFNMTPLKVAVTIAAQHMLTSVQNLPVSGNSPADTVKMLSGLAQELNKTAEIIKLTAEYMNISSHYMISTLDQFTKTSCEQNIVEDVMNLLKKNFLKIVSSHIIGAVKELNEKTRQREIAASDILISSAYHIVTAFQEMTSQVMTLTKEKSSKCSVPLPTIEITPHSNEITNKTDEKIVDIPVIPEQGKSHKSIKKDQAVPINGNKLSEVNFNRILDQLTIENLNGNQDLTVEVYSPETFLQNRQKVQISGKRQDYKYQMPEVKIGYVPLKTITQTGNDYKESLSGKNTEDDNINIKKEASTQTNTTNSEFDSSAVDSLTHMSLGSTESEVKDLNKASSPMTHIINKAPPNLANVLELLTPGYLHTSPLQPKQCDEHVEPVCGIDEDTKKFIIFLNDCKRQAHNKMYGTSYTSFSMETCVSLFLRVPRSGVQPADVNQPINNVDLRPR